MDFVFNPSAPAFNMGAAPTDVIDTKKLDMALGDVINQTRKQFNKQRKQLMSAPRRGGRGGNVGGRKQPQRQGLKAKANTRGIQARKAQANSARAVAGARRSRVTAQKRGVAMRPVITPKVVRATNPFRKQSKTNVAPQKGRRRGPVVTNAKKVAANIQISFVNTDVRTTTPQKKTPQKKTPQRPQPRRQAVKSRKVQTPNQRMQRGTQQQANRKANAIQAKREGVKKTTPSPRVVRAVAGGRRGEAVKRNPTRRTSAATGRQRTAPTTRGRGGRQPGRGRGGRQLGRGRGGRQPAIRKL